MSRYAVSGANSVAIGEATGNVVNLVGKTISTGRVFWLRSAWIYNAVSEFLLNIADSATSATGITGGTVNKMCVVCASGRTTMVDIPAPGLKFSTGCAVVFDVSGTVAVGDAGGNGYEE